MLKTGQMIKLKKRGATSNYPNYVCMCVCSSINKTQNEKKGRFCHFGLSSRLPMTQPKIMIISFLRKCKGRRKEYTHKQCQREFQHRNPSAKKLCSNFQNELTERRKETKK